MPNAAIYCRLSIEDRDKQSGDNSQSIQNQKAMLCEYCKERGWDIFDIYIDDGYSGIDRNRPAFCRLLHDCEAGKVNIVVCKDQSRFSRDIVVIEQIINDRFLEWGVRFIGVADNADTESESYSTLRLFTSAYNEMYVKDISAKIRRTLAYKREQGQFIGSFAPYGYAIDPDDKHHLVPDPETAPVIRQIFRMYAAGEGYRRIVQALNAQGILSPSAYKQKKGSRYVNVNAQESASRGLWTQSTIARILTNEMYAGTLVQGKSHHISYKNKKRRKVAPDDWVRIPDAHEAIIDKDTWSQTQNRLQSHARVGKRSVELSPLSGKVRCAVCGAPMKRNVYYNKSKTIQYYNLPCATCKTGAMNCPNTKTVSGLVLERMIVEELNFIVARYCQSEDIELHDLRTEELQRLKKQLSDTEAQRNAAKQRLVSMYKDKLDGLLPDEDYRLFRESLTAEEAQLARQTQTLQMQLAECQARSESAESRRALIEQYTHFEKLDRSIAEEFIESVEVGMPDVQGEREIHI
ncbi:MAG: recombinase family protein, partial [Oscillospiraceae bacterium]|nr:recombinase family protein [Oscillospiraceae bacterium]